MEKAIEEKKKQLWGTGAQKRYNPDEGHETFWEDGESFTERDGHLDDGDLEYINVILNSFSRDQGTHKNSNNSQLESFTPEDAQACALASPRTPSEFNLKFNQKSTIRESEENYFSYFSNVEGEGTSELGDYFSDNREDDTWDTEDLKSESHTWSHTDINDSKENLTSSQLTLSEWNSVISSLDTINEATFKDDYKASKLNHISDLSEETKLAFSTWQPFIPPGHAFPNCAAPSQLSDFLSQASCLQEPTLTRISTISTSTKRMSSPMEPTSPRLVISLSQPKELRQTEFPDPSEPLSQQLTTKPCKPFYSPTYSKTPTPRRPSFTNSSTKSALPNHEFQDLPEQSKRYKLWKQQSQGSTKTSQNQNTRFQNTPQVTDTGCEPQVYIQLKSQNYSTMKSKGNTTKIKSWETKWQKFSNKTPTYRTKLQKNTKPLRRSSGKTQLWHWSRERSLPICSLSTTATGKLIPRRKTSPGENHSSKRGSESKSFNHRKRRNTKSKSESSESKNGNNCRYKRQNFKSENKTENKDVKNIKVRKEKAVTEKRAKMTAKVNEVKAMGKTLTGFRIEIEKQLNKRIGSEPTITLPPHFTAIFKIPIFIYISMIITIFIFKNFISISNSVVSDPSDHHFQRFSIGNLSDCKLLCLSRQTASVQADTLVKTLANPDSIRPFKIPRTRPDIRYKNIPRNPLVPNHLLSGRVRKSETNLYHDSFIFNYLDFSR
jgi:hypothetical protein